MQTPTHTAPPAAGPPTPAALSTLVLRSRLTPAMRRLLIAMGMRIAPVRWHGFVGPQLDHLEGPASAPEWLPPEAAEDLLQVLREMEQRGSIPEWGRQWLVADRAGTLLNGDGSLELDGAPPVEQLLGLPRRYN